MVQSALGNGLIEIHLAALFGEMLHFSDDYRTQTHLNIEMMNSADRITVRNLPKAHRSEHAFTIYASDFSFQPGEPYRRVQKVLAFALSLLAETVIFSTARIGWLPIRLAEDLQDPNETLMNMTASRPIVFDEQEVLDIVSKLNKLDYGRGILGGIGEAVDTYSLILSSSTIETVYSHLFATIDKIVNNGRKSDLKASLLDAKVASELGIDQSIIKTIRTNANRLKHATGTNNIQELIDARNSVIQEASTALKWTAKYLRSKL